MQLLAAIVAASGWFTLAHAGVGVLSPEDESQALGLFRRLCVDGGQGGDIGGARVWCKFSPGEFVEVVNHNVEVPAPVLQDSVVFVQPPPVNFKHNIAVQGSPAIAPKTKIYVLPQKTSHAVSSQFNPGNLVTSKPTVYFLKSEFDQGLRYGTPAPKGMAGYA